MAINKLKLTPVLLIFALAVPVVALASGTAPANSNLTVKAETFIQTMAKGDFTAAEADFTDRMKQVTPDKLKGIWDGIVLQAGAFQQTGATKIVHAGGYTSVIVDTEFKNKTIGFAVTFDNSGKIGGLHLVPAV
ncbi:MAG: DUF3887 domain-containing protein [Gammaproteobacteria bacterium]